MTRENSPGRYEERRERRPNQAGEGELSGAALDSQAPDIYDRRSEAEWREAFALRRHSHRREERASLDVADPYESSLPNPSNLSERQSQRARFGEQPLLTSFTNNDTSKAKDKEDPARVPIREAMNTIRSIVARVKGGGAVGADDLSALSAAYDQLGAAALECKAVHNWPELKFVGHVRNLLGSYLGHSVAQSGGVLPKMEFTEGSMPVDSGRPSNSSLLFRRDIENAGELVAPKGASLERPRTDEAMTTALSHGSGGKREKESALSDQLQVRSLGEETGNLVAEPRSASSKGVPGRLTDLEHIGVLISQRERATKYIG